MYVHADTRARSHDVLPITQELDTAASDVLLNSSFPAYVSHRFHVLLVKFAVMASTSVFLTVESYYVCCAEIRTLLAGQCMLLFVYTEGNFPRRFSFHGNPLISPSSAPDVTPGPAFHEHSIRHEIPILCGAGKLDFGALAEITQFSV
jgi:hypothetical protein